MTKDYVLFSEPKKVGRTQIRDKYNGLICNASTEWERDKIFECITEVDRIRFENQELIEMLEIFIPHSRTDENGDEELLGGEFMYTEDSEYIGEEVIALLDKYKYNGMAK